MVQLNQQAFSLQVAENAGVTRQARASHVSCVTHSRQQDSFLHTKRCLTNTQQRIWQKAT